MVALPSRVDPGQRHTRRNPCPICHGGDGDRRGRGIRCYGFTSTDGRYALCTRDEYAGALAKHPRADGYRHRLEGGPCKCGDDHSASGSTAAAIRPATPARPAKVTRAHMLEAPTAIYSYRALEGGAPLRKLRYGSGKGKRFVWQVAEGGRDWRDCHGDRPAPDAYRADMLEGADTFEPLAITEGEKDADMVAQLGWRLVISPPDGVGSWRAEYAEHARGRQVVVFADSDEPGMTHAQDVAASVADVALSVRVVAFPGAKDAGEWIAAGHTFAELRTLAAQAPIIAARKLSSLNGSFTLQDDTSKTDPQSCPHCHQWKERARIAETTVRNLRAEQAIEDGYLAVANDTMSAPEKVAAIAMRRELATKKADDRVERDAERRPRIYRSAIAQRTGWKESQASANVQKVVALGFFERRERRSRDDTATFYAPGPLYNKPQAASAPERPNTWGGKRIKLCPCGSANLKTYTTRRIVCLDCGSQLESVTTEHDTNAVVDDPIDEREEAQSLNGSFTLQDDTSNDSHWSAADTQEEGQECFPPLSILVSDLAPADAGADEGGSCWMGGRVPDCEHPERMRHPTNPRLCGCGARFIPALDSAEVRTLTRRHGD